jgi:hypothetical protein
MNIKNIIFKYDDIYFKKQVLYNNLTFKLPIDSYELIEWATKLHNCMAMYAKSIRLNKTLIYGVFIDDNIKYAVRIENAKIVEMKGKYNKSIEKAETKIIEKWANTHNFKG